VVLPVFLSLPHDTAMNPITAVTATTFLILVLAN